mmetsp:Transcript_67596/g.124617  ORF Transcript_67596/g.124617 Transcript_67596/m.124617 type:complete len:103 (-) Transcript_67596:53-361(-)
MRALHSKKPITELAVILGCWRPQLLEPKRLRNKSSMCPEPGRVAFHHSGFGEDRQDHACACNELDGLEWRVGVRCEVQRNALPAEGDDCRGEKRLEVGALRI